jgi:hypothetical protein
MVVAAAAVAPSLPAAQPNQRPLHRCPNRRPPSARHRHHQPPPEAGAVAAPTSDDQPPPPLSPPQLPLSPPPPTTSCAPPSCCVVRSSAARLPRVVRPPTLVESSASSSPRAAPSASTPLVVSSVARPPRGNIATASLLRPPPPALSVPSTAGSCMPPARGHCRHHCRHNLILANERRCPSSRRKPRCLPRPWRVFWRKEHCWDHPPPTAPPLRRRCRRSPRGRRGEEAGEAIFVKAIDLPRTGHHCLPGGREHRAATIRVHPSPRCPPPPRASPRPRQPCAVGKAPRSQ